jgi:hypothetical protein
VFQVEVLSEEPYSGDSDLETIAYDITDGHCSGEVSCVRVDELNGKQAAEALQKQRSDPEFFLLDENGNDIEP